VATLNDADALLSDGIGIGRYPLTTGVWEGGHMVVSLDPRSVIAVAAVWATWEESWAIAPCGCGFWIWSRKKLSCRGPEFVRPWHRALAAGTATSIHLDGPKRFCIAGPNCDYVGFELTTSSHDPALISAASGARVLGSGTTLNHVESDNGVAVRGIRSNPLSPLKRPGT